jgi:hypothetical protein
VKEENVLEENDSERTKLSDIFGISAFGGEPTKEWKPSGSKVWENLRKDDKEKEIRNEEEKEKTKSINTSGFELSFGNLGIGSSEKTLGNPIVVNLPKGIPLKPLIPVIPVRMDATEFGTAIAPLLLQQQVGNIPIDCYYGRDTEDQRNGLTRYIEWQGLRFGQEL